MNFNNFKLVRRFKGGQWAKFEGEWYPVQLGGALNGFIDAGQHFLHHTNNCIETIEEYPSSRDDLMDQIAFAGIAQHAAQPVEVPSKLRSLIEAYTEVVEDGMTVSDDQWPEQQANYATAYQNLLDGIIAFKRGQL